MRGDQLTLGAVLARLEEREREITAQADAAKERIAELSAQLEEFHRTAEEIRITRKTLLELPEPASPAPPPPKLPDHPAYQQRPARSPSTKRQIRHQPLYRPLRPATPVR
ncbi:hypothetical protein ABT063_14780 [Streptomyces sp. NPDC002838]|uniref:hypothetical protein n=1 Tax=Streptomyces sp. NPDC002838 TaxID=3154436 RepID=UPI0033181B26